MRAISYRSKALTHSLCFYLHTLLYAGLSVFLVVAFVSCGASSSAVSALFSTGTPQPSIVPVPSTPTPDISHGWNSLIVAQSLVGDPEAFHVMHYNYLNGNGSPWLAQTLSSPGFDGISPDGHDLLYQLASGSQVQYYRTLLPTPGTGFFYTLPIASAGNALWLADGQHVLILMRGVGVMQVDTKSGQIQMLFSLPFPTQTASQIDIASLTFFHDKYLYFIGSAGLCEDTLCRVKLGTTSVQRISFRSLHAHYWLSPTGSTIFFANSFGPAGLPGVYSVNVDGSHLHLLRAYTQAIPIGFAADNALVVLRYLKGKFVALKIAATPQSDQILIANAAPGATSLCPPPASSPGTPILCDASIALAPNAYALVVQATFADNTSKLWSTDIITGKQHILQVGTAGNLPAPVQLLGWDRLPTS
jgi:hypothetical protein